MGQTKESNRAKYHHGALRERLLELGLEDLESKGPDAVSLRDLAQRAGVSKSAPHRHFPHREDLLRELALLGVGDLSAALESVRLNRPPPLEGLRAMGAVYVSFALARPGMYRLLFSESSHLLCPAPVVPGNDRCLELLVLQIKDCQAAGAMRGRDPAALALSFWALAHGTAHLAGLKLVQCPPEVDPIAFWTSVVDLVPTGLWA